MSSGWSTSRFSSAPGIMRSNLSRISKPQFDAKQQEIAQQKEQIDALQLEVAQLREQKGEIIFNLQAWAEEMCCHWSCSCE